MVTVCPSQFATRRTLFHVLVGCGLLMLKVSRLKLPVIWLLVSMWLNTLTKSQAGATGRCAVRKESGPPLRCGGARDRAPTHDWRNPFYEVLRRRDALK